MPSVAMLSATSCMLQDQISAWKECTLGEFTEQWLPGTVALVNSTQTREPRRTQMIAVETPVRPVRDMPTVCSSCLAIPHAASPVPK